MNCRLKYYNHNKRNILIKSEIKQPKFKYIIQLRTLNALKCLHMFVKNIQIYDHIIICLADS